jgi:hypothetical protein
MAKGYYVYSGITQYEEPVASFSTLANAERLSRVIASQKEPVEIEGELPDDIDKFIPQLEAGLIPYDVFLLLDGTIFEVDNGFEDSGVLLFDPEYYPEQNAFTGTFWAHDKDEAIDIARAQLMAIQAKL